MVVAHYPVLFIVSTMAIAALGVVWIWMLVRALADVFGRRDISGRARAGWTVLLVALPFLGVLAYLIAGRAGTATGEGEDPATEPVQGKAATT